MAKAIFEVETQGVSESVNSVKGLEKELERLRGDFEDLEIGSAEFNRVGEAIKATETKLKNIDLQFESLDKEQRLSAIGDTFGGIVGSVGVATGALVAFGVESEALENVEQRLTGVLTAVISFKEAQEGAIAVQKLLNIQGKSFNQILKANPIGAIITALGLLTTAVVLLKDKFEAVNKVFTFFKNIALNVGDALGIIDKEQMAVRDSAKELVPELEFQVELLKAQGATAEEVAQKERELLETRIKATKEGTDARKEAEQALTLFEAQEETKRREAQAKAIEEQKKKDKERLDAIKEARKAEYEELKAFYYEALSQQREALAELQILNDKEIEALFKANADALASRVNTTAEKTTQIRKKTNREIVQQAQDTLLANAELAEQVVGNSVEVAGQLASTLGQLVDDGSEKGFEASKKYKIAEIITSAIQGSFQAFTTSLASFPAPIGAIVGATQVAGIAIASRRAIQEVRSSTFEGNGSGASSPSTPSIPSVGAPINGGNFQGGTGFLTPTAPTTTPTPAYVVAGDVQNGLQALDELNTRRRFG